jgi:hypothetical protein
MFINFFYLFFYPKTPGPICEQVAVLRAIYSARHDATTMNTAFTGTWTITIIPEWIIL